MQGVNTMDILDNFEEYFDIEQIDKAWRRSDFELYAEDLDIDQEEAE